MEDERGGMTIRVLQFKNIVTEVSETLPTLL